MKIEYLEQIRLPFVLWPVYSRIRLDFGVNKVQRCFEVVLLQSRQRHHSRDQILYQRKTAMRSIKPQTLFMDDL